MGTQRDGCYQSIRKAQADLVHELRNGFVSIRTQTQKVRKHHEGMKCHRWCGYWLHEIDSQLLRMQNALADFREEMENLKREGE
jgi:hypothetical protein